MNTETLREFMESAMVDFLEDYSFDLNSFKDIGVLTDDEGLVFNFHNGDEFQITIVQSKFAEQKQSEGGEK